MSSRAESCRQAEQLAVVAEAQATVPAPKES